MMVGSLLFIFGGLGLSWLLGVLQGSSAILFVVSFGLVATGAVVSFVGFLLWLSSNPSFRVAPVGWTARKVAGDKVIQLAAAALGLATLTLPWFVIKAEWFDGTSASIEIPPLAVFVRGVSLIGALVDPSGLSSGIREAGRAAALILIVGVSIYVLGCAFALYEGLDLYRRSASRYVLMYLGLLIAFIGLASFGTKTTGILGNPIFTVVVMPTYGFFLAIVAAIIVSISPSLTAKESRATM